MDNALMQRFIEHARKEVAMVNVKALIDFGGTVINREELGFVRKGTEIQVSGNDAAYLEREGYAERVAPAEPTAATPSEPSTAPPST